VGAISAATSANQVDLPQPDGPDTSSTPPCGTATSAKASSGPPGYW
jgi:hypothetical protein